jgi:predicted porin
MKKSLLALAVLGAFTGVASAQSSVTLYGTLDANGRYVKADGRDRRVSMATDGINSSQLGFRGVEDLGGGLKAGFNIIASLGVDDGDAGSGQGNGKFWNRRSTVSLFSNAGELRLGRDYTPTFWNLTIFDAFGTNGLGSSTNPRQVYGGTRQDNSIGYFLPSNLGGFYGQVMAGASEGGTSADRAARYLGGRFGVAAGPFDVAGADAEQKYRAGQAISAGGGVPVLVPSGATQKTWNVGGSWNFGFLKLMGYYDEEKVSQIGAKEKMYSISANMPFGQAEVRVGYDRSKGKFDGGEGGDFNQTVEQLKATLQYNVSKRTALYTTVSRLNNKDDTALTLPGAAGATESGGKSTGFEIGVRHFF